jgi:hypothetical protein
LNASIKSSRCTPSLLLLLLLLLPLPPLLSVRKTLKILVAVKLVQGWMPQIIKTLKNKYIFGRCSHYCRNLLLFY